MRVLPHSPVSSEARTVTVTILPGAPFIYNNEQFSIVFPSSAPPLAALTSS